ncbi:helix-hairpin-helix domain-containing protein [Cellulomonas sp. 179-A 4D5 NHS]|uniref:helix-hairpin-helix domain-containing protein n=1 Tax=Cellulomonas sp. 179-A 4D5 NHS TaxID=3142378 RepID=UPI0039A13808
MSTTDGAASGGVPLTPRIGRPALGALAHVGITTLDEVARLSEAELLALHGVGPKAVRLLRESLAAEGLSLRDDG